MGTLFGRGRGFPIRHWECGEVQVPVPETWAHFSCLPPLAQAVAPYNGSLPRQGSAFSLCPLCPLEFLCQLSSSLSLTEVSRDRANLRSTGKGDRLGRRKGWARQTWAMAEEGLNSRRGQESLLDLNLPRAWAQGLKERPHPGTTAGYPGQEISLPNTSRTRGVSFMLFSGWKEMERYCLECSSLRLLRSANFWIILA